VLTYEGTHQIHTLVVGRALKTPIMTIYTKKPTLPARGSRSSDPVAAAS
jgi:hypothetical protein